MHVSSEVVPLETFNSTSYILGLGLGRSGIRVNQEAVQHIGREDVVCVITLAPPMPINRY